MFRQRGRHQRTLRQLGAAFGALLVALLVASPVSATTGARSSQAAAANTKEWCAAVIRINTKLGTMKNKHYLPAGQVPLSTWKKVVDAAIANRSQLLAITPSSIKTAQTHQLAWFARVKASHYNRVTPLGSFTLADVAKLTNFQRTQCGITF